MFANEDEVKKAIEDGTATAGDVWAFALSNKLNEGGKKALDAERDARKSADQLSKDLQKQLDEATSKLTTVTKDGLPEWQQQINDLKAKLDGESEARSKAEAKSAAAERTQYGIDKGLPMALAKRLVGASEEELEAEVGELLPLVGPTGPRPNPQQGNPSEGRGGTLTAGRALYESANPK